MFYLLRVQEIVRIPITVKNRGVDSAQGVLKKHPFCGAFLVFWGFKFLSIKVTHQLFI
ncbi:hypothetical protein ECMP0209802_5080 [Escherichia coli MP020980.2]|nr:hypothetical protein ECMP0209802_5080 [Escherichia coli MP020980.2]ENH26388.1 hypothetical protein ECP03048163_5409 [Escherichia coli P0304816.3]